MSLSEHARLRFGQVVVDRSGVMVGRVDEVHAAQVLAVADDGREISDALDLNALVPGWFRRQLPLLEPQVAAGLVRDGYLRTHLPPSGRPVRYVAFSTIAEITDQAVCLRCDLTDLPAL